MEKELILCYGAGMKKFFKIAASIILSLLFIIGVFTSVVMLWSSNFDSFLIVAMFSIVAFNLLMLYYVNWAIWTKGKIRKIIMFIAITCIFLLLTIIIAYE